MSANMRRTPMKAWLAWLARLCVIAGLQSRDSSLVAMSDRKERELVRENYLKKKLGLTHPDADLDTAVLAVGERMKADRTKNRVTVYYLLAEHFGSLGLFGGATGGSAASAAIVGGAVGLAAMAPAAAAAASGGSVNAPQAVSRNKDNDFNFVGWGCAAAVVVLGAIILAALLAWYADRPAVAPAAAPAPVVAAPAPAPATAAQSIPIGAGVTTEERDGKPMLTVYFDTAKSDVTNDLAAAAANVKDYVAKNPGATLAVSGFNDPTGNAAANAALSKKRAQAVGKALESAGIPAAAIELVKPVETTDTSGDNTNARRVEVVVQ